MLNKYPLWKSLMVLFIVAFGALYALPNKYGEDPAVQISGKRSVEVSARTLDSVKAALEENAISFTNVSLEQSQVLIRFSDTEAQLKARDLLDESLGDDYSVAINLTPATPDWLAALGGTPMKLGLDLSGGVSFLMEVNMKEAVDKAEKGMIDDFRAKLREEKLRYRTVKKSANDGVDVVFRNEADLEKGLDILESDYRDLLFSENTDKLTVNAVMTEQKLKEVQEYALQQNITIIRNRVNELGVAEPLVQRQGKKHIVIELPGIQDTAEAKEILNATATIEFRMVDQQGDLGAALNGRVPASSQLLYDGDGRPSLIKKRVMLTGDHIVDANSGFDPETSRPQVSITLDSAGGTKFSHATKNNIGKPMASVFIEYKPTNKKDAEGNTIFEKKEEIISIATIQARLGKDFRITGSDSPAEARNLALLLRAGALVAPIQIVEERTVGPSLGQENIELGFQAIVLGFVLVFVFMMVYYRAFGIVANLALLSNLILIVAVMSMLGAVLTLPGMAGIVLTVGMAVDANVLIFERIREELRGGKTVQQAIHHGYDSAFSTILDANITTLIAAIILFAVGTGPIKGFAITLSIGILTSMFTSIVGTRSIVNALWGGKRLDKLSI